MSGVRIPLFGVLLLVGCAERAAPAPTGSGGMAGGGGAGGASVGGTGGMCSPTPGPVQQAAPCNERLEHSSCSPTFTAPRTPQCTLDAFGQLRYTGPREGYLINAVVDNFFGEVCIYDPTSAGLVAGYQFTDIPSYCCSTAFAIWYGPRLPQVTNGLRGLCQLVDGGATVRD